MPGHGEQVSLERLRQLLDQGEGIDLDFKRACNLNERKELLRITKDIAAFAATGGHLIVGVNEDGTPSGLFDASHVRLFDEATLRSKIAPKYLPETISITTAVHEFDHAATAIVYVAPHPDGFVVIQRDGETTQIRAASRVRSSGRERSTFVAEVRAGPGTTTRRLLRLNEPWRDGVSAGVWSSGRI